MTLLRRGQRTNGKRKTENGQRTEDPPPTSAPGFGHLPGSRMRAPLVVWDHKGASESQVAGCWPWGEASRSAGTIVSYSYYWRSHEEPRTQCLAGGSVQRFG